jgi:hypothetical protein
MGQIFTLQDGGYTELPTDPGVFSVRLSVHLSVLSKSDVYRDLTEEFRSDFPWEQSHQVLSPDTTGYFYSFSDLDTKDKYTLYAERCIVQVLVGKTMDGETLTQIFHFSPGFFKPEEMRYHEKFRQALAHFYDRTVAGSRISVVSGGNKEFLKYEPDDTRKYEKAQKFLVRQTQQIANPTIYIAEPKASKGYTNIFIAGNRIHLKETQMKVGKDGKKIIRK